ncbi:hypothetical protein EVJ27_13150 [Exiguobacterium sp. SH3S2]|uniref:hypothetical protein n=1 Tax=unclassified Exiguobacterium TaxID=2644629 RepID=UPI0010393267|nr:MULTISPECIES: hypothetical protein [unclassified Exiguobacterium]TCI42000.1 hypothetical protein EVJ28_13245 [Exiguobacterium sp. SH3S3]TCI58302.1 hypothetical protein EVJ27_13150 [Exiguobacterium sp. SH3S2]
MNKAFLIIMNIITGLVVTALTIFALGISGMAEGPQPASSYYWLLLFGVWFIGLVMQLKKSTRVIGLVVTFLPILYFVSLFVFEFL